MRRDRRLATAAAALAALLLVVLFRAPIARALLTAGASLFTQTHVSFGAMSLALREATLDDVRIVSTGGEPIATIERLHVAYDLRDVFPGGTRQFGLRQIQIDRPHLILIRHPDGSFNVPIPKQSKTPGVAKPFIFTGAICNGSIELVDQTRANRGATPIDIATINAAFDVDSSALSRYTLSLAYRLGARRYPLVAGGVVDFSRGFMLQRIRARVVPLPQLFNYLTDNAALRMRGGELDDIDVRAFAFEPNGTMQAHYAGGAVLRNGTIALAALTSPVRDLHGRFDITDDAVTTSGIQGRIQHLAADVTGAVYDLQHPQARFAVDGRVPLQSLRRLARAAAPLAPLNGPIAFKLLVEGSAFQPVALLQFTSSRFLYNGIPLDGTSGLAAASTAGVDVLSAATAFANEGGSMALGALGHVSFSKSPNALRLLVTGSAPAQSLPFVAGFVPGMTLNAQTLATAEDPRLIETRGIVSGATATQSALGAFHVSSDGVGTIGPIAVGNDSSWLYSRITLDHPRSRVAALVRADNFRVVPAAAVSLGPFRTSPIPSFSGTLDADAIGSVNGGRVGALGWSAIRHATVGSLPISTASATFALQMRPNGLDVYGIRARTPVADAYASGSLGNGGALRVSASGPLVSGNAVVAGRLGDLAIRNAMLEVGSALLTARGRIGQTYDLNASVSALDVHEAAQLASPSLAGEVTGSADADVHVAGSGAHPSVSGSVDVPEGSVYGEGFNELNLQLNGTASGVNVGSGRMLLGSSPVAFEGYLSPSGSNVSLRSSALDLADLNDFFDTGDMFAGRGRLNVSLATGGVLATSGSAAFRGARLRGLDIGNAVARWTTAGNALHLDADTGGSIGDFSLRGAIGLPPEGTMTTGVTRALRSMDFDLAASARNADLGTLLPFGGFTIPVVGRANANVGLRGRYPGLAIDANAFVGRATVGRIPIDSFSITATARNGRGVLRGVRLSMPYLGASGSGTFGLDPARPFDLAVQAQSPNLGSLAAVATGHKNSLAGALQTRMRLRGTISHPNLSGNVAMMQVRYNGFTVPRMKAGLVADANHIALQNGEADLTRGRLLAAGEIPLHTHVHAHRFTIADAHVAAHVTAQDVELSNFSALLPNDSRIAGRIDGRIDVGGTLSSPHFSGGVNLTGGAYQGNLDKAPLDDITGQLVLENRTILLRGLHANVGGGSLDGSGTVAVRNLEDPAGATANLDLSATRAYVDSPKYYTGRIDARIETNYARGHAMRVGGFVTVSHARVPVSALYNPSSSTSSAPPLQVAFHDFGINVGPDVRIQNSNVDVGGTGSAVLNGTLASPSLSGAFEATGGTISFYQIFRVQRARVSFDPSGGIMPYVDAEATTSIASPPTDIRIHVTGPATNMNLGLSSDPNYDREQILGLLVGMQSFGAVQGVPGTTATPFSATAAVRGVGFGQANQIFTRSILDPVSTALGGALGASNLQLYNNFGTGYGTGIGATIEKRLTQHVTLTAASSFGYPRQETVSFRYVRKDYSGVSLQLYQQQQQFLNSTPPGIQQNPSGLNLQPSENIVGSATSGFLLSFQKKWWSCAFWHYSCSLAQR